MPREGTRSATGNSKPRVFQNVDTAPTIKRSAKPRTKTSVAGKATGSKPAGITKKTAAPKTKNNGLGAKVKATAKKVEAKVKGTETKTKKTAKPKAVVK
jgi:hypothetical protein